MEKRIGGGFTIVGRHLVPAKKPPERTLEQWDRMQQLNLELWDALSRLVRIATVELAKTRPDVIEDMIAFLEKAKKEIDNG
jgi:hypothetical protein